MGYHFTGVTPELEARHLRRQPEILPTFHLVDRGMRHGSQDYALGFSITSSFRLFASVKPRFFQDRQIFLAPTITSDENTTSNSRGKDPQKLYHIRAFGFSLAIRQIQPLCIVAVILLPFPILFTFNH